MSLPATTSGDAALPAADSSHLSRVEKAAIVMIALGPQAASALLSDMGDDRIRRFAHTVTRMKQVPAPVVDAVLEEFIALLEDNLTLQGGPEELRQFLGEALDTATANRMLEDMGGSPSIWNRLSEVEEMRLAAWLKMEHPQIVAIILTKINSVKAAKVLERLESDIAQTVVLRMSRVASVDPAILGRMADSIERDFLPTVQREKGASKPVDTIAGLMNHVSAQTRDSILQRIETERPQLAQNIQRVMFTFSDIVERVAARDIGTIVKSLDEQILMQALKAGQKAADPSAEFILDSISKRLAERMREDLAAMAEPSRKEGEAAQGELAMAIRGMVDRGQIKLIERDTNDG
ncbi:MAG: FliG C-terminal domain-containing protein [Pseudomonadota bacterium]